MGDELVVCDTYCLIIGFVLDSLFIGGYYGVCLVCLFVFIVCFDDLLIVLWILCLWLSTLGVFVVYGLVIVLCVWLCSLNLLAALGLSVKLDWFDLDLWCWLVLTFWVIWFNSVVVIVVILVRFELLIGLFVYLMLLFALVGFGY